MYIVILHGIQKRNWPSTPVGYSSASRIDNIYVNEILCIRYQREMRSSIRITNCPVHNTKKKKKNRVTTRQQRVILFSSSRQRESKNSPKKKWTRKAKRIAFSTAHFWSPKEEDYSHHILWDYTSKKQRERKREISKPLQDPFGEDKNRNWWGEKKDRNTNQNDTNWKWSARHCWSYGSFVSERGRVFFFAEAEEGEIKLLHTYFRRNQIFRKKKINKNKASQNPERKRRHILTYSCNNEHCEIKRKNTFTFSPLLLFFTLDFLLHSLCFSDIFFVLFCFSLKLL